MIINPRVFSFLNQGPKKETSNPAYEDHAGALVTLDKT